MMPISDAGPGESNVAPLAEADGIARLRLSSSFGQEARQALSVALDRIGKDPSVRILVIAGAPRGWPRGDGPEDEAQRPTPAELAGQIDGLRVPVIAAIETEATGAGLAFALAASWRVAREGARFAFPEAAVGLCPGGGATQRLPQRIGARNALSLMLSALPIGTAQALRDGLVDALAQGRAEEAALEVARAFVARGDAPWQARSAPAEMPAAYLDAVARARADLGRSSPLPAPGRIIDCIEAALLLPPAEGFDFERWTVAELAATRQARALRHLTRAEARLAQATATRPRPVALVAVIGSAPAGAEFSTAALSAGLGVLLVERDVESLASATARVKAGLDQARASGRLDPDTGTAALARLAGSTDLAAVASCDLVLSALGSDEDDELLLFADLATLVRPGAILACGADGVEMTGLAAMTGRAADVVGLRMAPGARLAEVAGHPDVDARVVAGVVALSRRIGRLALVTGPEAGGLLTRLWRALMTACAALMEEGADPYGIDRTLRRAGLTRPPFAELDRIGLDGPQARDWLGAATMGTRGARIGLLTGALLAQGRTGRAASAGFYLYDEGRRREDPTLGNLWAGSGRASGPPAPVMARLALAALANEGARLVARGMAADPAAVDLVAVHGMGLARPTGGPMIMADEAGLLRLRNVLKARAEAAGPAGRPGFWMPVPLWDDLIRDGASFADWSRPQ